MEVLIAVDRPVVKVAPSLGDLVGQVLLGIDDLSPELVLDLGDLPGQGLLGRADIGAQLLLRRLDTRAVLRLSSIERMAQFLHRTGELGELGMDLVARSGLSQLGDLVDSGIQPVETLVGLLQVAHEVRDLLAVLDPFALRCGDSIVDRVDLLLEIGSQLSGRRLDRRHVSIDTRVRVEQIASHRGQVGAELSGRVSGLALRGYQLLQLGDSGRHRLELTRQLHDAPIGTCLLGVERDRPSDASSSGDVGRHLGPDRLVVVARWRSVVWVHGISPVVVDAYPALSARHWRTLALTRLEQTGESACRRQ